MLIKLRMRFSCRSLQIMICLLAFAGYESVSANEDAQKKQEYRDSLPMEFGQALPDINAKYPLSSAMSRAFADPSAKGLRLRKGLAVIADFSDVRLEDWQGEGINNVTELSEQLRKMREHWAWLSRGSERFHWDILRVTLPVNLSANAYANWEEYRAAVANLIKQQINTADYDANGDGIVDSAWIITSNNGQYYDYMVGGTSRHEGVNIFVDGQNSGSVIAGATGNFNHELAHTLGVPDLYGKYDTLHYLTLMSDSWALPPQDFTAYERTLLGWVKPKSVYRTKQGIRLLPPNKGKRMDAIRVYTPRASEYFLIEFRRRPDHGFGSNAPFYRGLAVYHVLESSNQGMDPPLVKLVAADGYIAPDTAPQMDDFLHPRNPNMLKPLVMKSYYGGQDVFEIDNLWQDTDGSFVFDIKFKPMNVTRKNLLNTSFERGAGSLPYAWQTNAWVPANTNFMWEASIAKKGQHSVSISSTAPNDAMWMQTVTGLDLSKTYAFCGWLRGQDIATGPGADIGGNVSVLGGFTLSQSLSGSFDWTQVCVNFKPENTNTILACRLGFFGSTVTGKLWCDGMTLDSLVSAFK